MDRWAALHPDEQVVAQIGESDYRPNHVKWHRFLNPSDHEDLLTRARCVVGHAGMGTILGAMDHRKPLVVMPRVAQYGEHRNDHQVATVRKLMGRGMFCLAENEIELFEHLLAPALPQPENLETSDNLLNSVQRYLQIA